MSSGMCWGPILLKPFPLECVDVIWVGKCGCAFLYVCGLTCVCMCMCGGYVTLTLEGILGNSASIASQLALGISCLCLPSAIFPHTFWVFKAC